MSNIETLMKETRRFNPKFDHQWPNEAIEAMYGEAFSDPESFWHHQAISRISWFKEPKKKCTKKFPSPKWFEDGVLNVSYNCIDRHVENGLGDKLALIFESEAGDVKKITYKDLLKEVNRAASKLKNLGIKKGDRVAISLPMIPELVFVMLACTRIGAIHTIIFGGFSSEAIKDRSIDAKAKLIITADGGFRRGKLIELKKIVDESFISQENPVKKVAVIKWAGNPINMFERDIMWNDINASDDIKPEPMKAEDPLFILYTSGSTGKPKGVVHTTGGYLLQTNFTTQLVFDLRPEDIYWCTADIGWITGHSYVAYGVLSNGGTSVIYEGAPNFPNESRFWEMIDRHKVSIFYTAPTAIRAFMSWGDQHVTKSSLKSLRVLGSVGEPINPEAWLWYYKIIGKEKLPIVDTWWQTETGSIQISPIPGYTTLKPGSATNPLPGCFVNVVDDKGKSVPAPQGGLLILEDTWPSQLRGLWGDPKKFKDVYFSKFKNKYFAGDGVHQDLDGDFWIMGRIDDVVNVSGHRIGTAEVESALVGHHSTAEAAVVGIDHQLKGQALVAFCVLKRGVEETSHTENDLKEQIVKEIGVVAKPETIYVVEALPKTRSGKIMRRILKDIAQGKDLKQDITTLEDRKVVENIIAKCKR